MTNHLARPITPAALKELRDTDDSGHTRAPFTDEEGGAPLRCCLRPSRSGERLLLVSYAPLRRWAAESWAQPGAYDEQGPVFIHAEECGGPAGGGYPYARPGALRTVRRYSAEGRILGGRLLELPENADAGVDTAAGTAVDTAFDDAFDEAFADPEVALVHVRAVEFGCFHFEVRRA
ncbi:MULTISPECIES: DUF1203 domain-containing protein [unclassified Streptomyces]|uniref:DUF1203 domain-containing protein n=1 Tax=unclassified Streptomyces TaxID=2593676 RepID=UPI0037F2093D